MTTAFTPTDVGLSGRQIRDLQQTPETQTMPAGSAAATGSAPAASSAPASTQQIAERGNTSAMATALSLCHDLGTRIAGSHVWQRAKALLGCEKVKPFTRERFMESLHQISPQASTYVSGKMRDRFADSPEARAIADAIASRHSGLMRVGDLDVQLGYHESKGVYELQLPVIGSHQRQHGAKGMNLSLMKLFNGVVDGICRYLENGNPVREVRISGKRLVNPQLYDALVSLGFKESREPGSLTLDTNLRLDIPLR